MKKHRKQDLMAAGQSRRDFLRINAVAGAGLLFPWVARGSHEETIKNLPKLDATTIPKYVQPLFVAPAPMPTAGAVDYYELAIRQFTQQILPPPYPRTRVAGYVPASHAPGSWTYQTPAIPIVTQARNDNDPPVRIKWINDQRNPDGTFQPHVLASEMFPDHVMWANPPGPIDSHGKRFIHSPYTGPVPIVTHLHGGHTKQQSDGHPLAWYLPAATNLTGFYRSGGLYDDFKALAAGDGAVWQDGNAIFDYAGNDVATLLWCHDHTLGITEFNVYAGFAGGFAVGGGAYDLPPGVLPSGAFEIPLVIQDRAFKPDGSLLFHAGIEHPGSGDTIMVNGRTWPYLNVERRRYRFRVLNGCNNRNLNLRLSSSAAPMWLIGGDVGFLPRAVQVKSLPMTNAERADVIVDFTSVPVGTVLYLTNTGGDARANTTGQVMKFVVGDRVGADTSLRPDLLGALPVKTLTTDPPVTTRRVAALDERQGIVDAAGNVISLEFEDPPTETPAKGSTEIWEIWGFDSHPMHLHAAHFKVLDRRAFDGTNVRGPKAWERGIKDTVDINENGITRVLVKFDDHAGLFVWHCHLLAHEDLGMMRPLELQP